VGHMGSPLVSFEYVGGDGRGPKKMYGKNGELFDTPFLLSISWGRKRKKGKEVGEKGKSRQLTPYRTRVVYCFRCRDEIEWRRGKRKKKRKERGASGAVYVNVCFPSFDSVERKKRNVSAVPRKPI